MKYNFDEFIDRRGSGSIKYDKMNFFFGRDDLQPLWVADMDFATPNFILSAIKKRLEHPVLGYTMRKPSFNHSFMNWMKKRHGWKIEENWLDFSPGVVTALAVAILALTDENDEIIIQPPVYHPFFDVVEGNKRTLLENPLKKDESNSYKMDFSHLKSIINEKTKMIIVSNPHNPVGRVWKKEELRKLAQIAIENNLIILSDDIHSDFVYQPHIYTPIASLSSRIAQQTITITSPSKTFNIAGLSTSIVVIPNKTYKQKYTEKLRDMHLFLGNIFGSVAFETAYENGAQWLEDLLQYLSGNINYAIDYIDKNIPAIHAHKPEGTFLMWLDFSNTKLPHDAIKNKLINNAKIAFNDGMSFGKNADKHFRMNIGTPRNNIHKVLKTLERVFQ